MTEIVGTPGDDTLNGTGSGTSDGDTITGLAGNDDVTVGPNDNADGGADTDTLSVFHFGSPVGATIDLRLLWNGGVGSNGSGLLTGFEHLGYILGSNGNDIIRLGTSGAVVAGLAPFARGHEGDDFLEGGGGLDRLQGDEGNDVLLGFGGDDQLQGNSGIDHIEGGDGDDSISGGLDADVLIGGVGSDTYIYGDGSLADEDQIIENAADAGLDRLLVRANVGNVIDTNFANVRNIEVAELSTLNDVVGFEFTLSAQFDAAAFQTIIASADIDASLTNRNYSYVITPPNIRDLTILAGSGNDNFSLALYAPYAGSVFAINGGAGNDSITFSNSVGPISFDVAAGALVVNGLAAGSYVNFENVTGSEFSDVLTGSSENNLIAGGGGNDVIFGQDGDDDIFGDDGNDTIDGGLGQNTVMGGDGDDTFQMSVVSSGFPDSIYDGGNGFDTLDFHVAGSFLFFQSQQSAPNELIVGDNIVRNVESYIGGSGGDIFSFGWFTAGVQASGGLGNDNFSGGSGADVFYGGAGDDAFNNVAAGDMVYGGGDNDTFFVSGSFGTPASNGVIDGGAGFNSMSLNISFSVDLSAGTAVSGTASYSVSGFTDVLAAAIYGYATTISGSAASERFRVNALFNDGSVGVQFFGRGGSDRLEGSLGNDLLDGGEGSDVLIGDGGDDILLVDKFDSIISGGSGTDRMVFGGSGTITGALSSIEAVELLGGASLSLSGSQFANGLAKTTAVSGTGSITVNMDAGINFLSQGFAFTGSNVTVVVNGSSGADIIKAGGSAHIINGGGGADQIRGGTAADAIDGGADNDKILGFTGADILTGGTGNDQFRYLFAGDSGLGAGADRITDFASGSDRLNFALLDTNAGLTGVQGFTFVGNAAFSGGGAASIRYANSGADLLVQADINGDGIADMEIILQGLNGGTLTAADFIL